MYVTVCIGAFTPMSGHPNPTPLFLLFSAFGSEFGMGVNGLTRWGTDRLSRWMFPHISWCLCCRHGKHSQPHCRTRSH